VKLEQATSVTRGLFVTGTDTEWANAACVALLRARCGGVRRRRKPIAAGLDGTWA
jgi:hypothetical protein